MIAAAVTGQRRSYERTPEHHRDRIRKQKRRRDGKTSVDAHGGTMESKSASVNDDEMHLVVALAA